ncbi:DUF4251 domain-containing protein [Gaoshiqia sp. Z1-71]|uniref:DUF4251 domain-containing protein n=1 Tax=Gaoshiqia hydrogeniformans TaxID=3290090 RepID=UPI003BF8740E
MKRIILLLMIVLAGTSCCQAQKLSAKERRIQKEQEIKTLIESRKFSFEAQSALPLSMRKIDLTSRYNLTIDSTWIEAWLPFFGRAYQADYGSTDGGIKFREQAKSLQVRFSEKKKLYLIDMEVKTEKDNYKIQISAGLGGYANVNVVSNNRQSIGFYGTIESLPEKEE